MAGTAALTDQVSSAEGVSVNRRSRVESASFVGYRFPPEVILLAVRWYLRYGLSYRDVEELLAERGIEVDNAPSTAGYNASHQNSSTRRDLVGAEYCVVTGQAAFRYSLMSRWHRVDFTTWRRCWPLGSGSGS